MSIGLAHPRREMGVSVAELNLRFLSDLVTSGQAGKIGTAYVVSPKGELLASSDADQKRGADLSKLPQVAALIGSTSADAIDRHRYRRAGSARCREGRFPT